MASQSGTATLLDMRRASAYDSLKTVDRYLNLPEVKEALGVDRRTQYVSCSPAVAEAMGPDVMRSVKHLLPDILERLPVLLYQVISRGTRREGGCGGVGG